MGARDVREGRTCCEAGEGGTGKQTVENDEDDDDTHTEFCEEEEEECNGIWGRLDAGIDFDRLNRVNAKFLFISFF